MSSQLDPPKQDHPASDISPISIVGIGASAGGLKSIEALFEKMPVDTGMAFVVIQHLSPDFKSLMQEILSRRTKMPVITAAEGMSLEANKVYVIPPGKELYCSGTTLDVADFPQGLHRPIDAFFKCIATNQIIPAIGIVLSGTGSDGSEGLTAIHGVGGLTIAESVESAEFDGMPLSATRTGCVDLVLEPSEIAHALLNHQAKLDQGLPDEVDLAGVRQIFSLIEARYRIPFDQYKPRTISRRIDRRRQIGRFRNVNEYAEFLSSNEDELDELYHDLLIGVTKFFRDRQAFDLLQDQIHAAIKDLAGDDTFRIWSVGCATGEEPYSIAMLALDAFEELNKTPRLKVFATDIHQRTLEQAAIGEYELESMEYVSLDRQRKYFDRIEGRLRVNSRLRKHLVFSNHNAIQDPPFTKINLVSCRNMLIYLRPSAQATTLAQIHFALVMNGLFFMGASESLGELASEFSEIDRTWRIYRKLRDRRDLASHLARLPNRGAVAPEVTTLNLLNADDRSPITVRGLIDLYDAMLSSKVSIGLLLDRRQNLVHAFGDTSKILRSASGRFRGSIRDFLDAPARTTIVAALIRAENEPGTNFIIEDVQPNNDDTATFDVSVEALPANGNNSVGWILEFQATDPDKAKTIRVTPTEEDAYELLESELQFTKESLSASVEELEASNEELQATNEEMIASNEELQSTNEELHSVNEELYSVNAELQRKIELLEETTNDLETLLASSDIGTVFLDAELRIRKFTAAITPYFNLMSHDVGRPLSDFTSRLGLRGLLQLLSDVVSSGNEYATTCVDDYGEACYVKIVPYRQGIGISGAVLTVLNHKMVLTNASFWMAYGTVGTWEWPDVNRDVMWWSPTCNSLLGLTSDTPQTFSQWKALIHPEDVPKLEGVGTIHCRFVELGQIHVRMKCGDDIYRPFTFQNISRLDEDGVVRGLAGTISNANVVASSRAEEAERTLNMERTLVDLQDFAKAISPGLEQPLLEVRNAASTFIDSDSNASAEEITSIAGRLERKLSCLLEYASVGTKGGNIVECNTDEVLSGVLDEFSDRITAHDADIKHEPLVNVRADPKQLRTVFWHLLDNALKYNHDEPPKIHITSTVKNEWATITVRDYGRGIPIVHLQEVFDIFRRIAPHDAIPGDGFGLALCKRIVHRHGGRIWAERHREAGMSFHLRLNAVPDRDSKPNEDATKSELSILPSEH